MIDYKSLKLLGKESERALHFLMWWELYLSFSVEWEKFPSLSVFLFLLLDLSLSLLTLQVSIPYLSLHIK